MLKTFIFLFIIMLFSGFAQDDVKIISLNDLKQKEDEKEAEIQKRLDLIFELADLGDPNGLREAGNLYYFGRHVKQNYKKAVKYYFQGAEKNEPHCLFNLAQCYFHGYGVRKNLETALKYFRKSALLGLEQGVVNTAKLLDYFKQYKEARRFLETAYYQFNSSLVVNELVDYYEQGIGGEKNLTKVIGVLKTLAKNGDAKVQYKLANYYKNSVEHYSYEDAWAWLSLSANNGYAPAQFDLASYFFTQKPINQEQVFTWTSLAAKQNYPKAISFLGDLYRFGIGVKADFKKAIEFYKRAYELNSKDSYIKFKLSEAYFFGIGIDQNQDKALALLDELIEEKYTPCLVFLSESYFSGSNGFEKNLKKSFDLLEKTLESPTPYSLFLLGRAYLYGYGVKSDIIKAKLFLELSLEQGNSQALDLILENNL